MNSKKSVLITGCSAGGIGSALAEIFHHHGWLVFATARDLNKVQHLKALGCEIILLGVTSDETIQAAVQVVQNKADRKLDMLINNATLGIKAYLSFELLFQNPLDVIRLELTRLLQHIPQPFWMPR
jgi:1-acylglycerone phosphate reductase